MGGNEEPIDFTKTKTYAWSDIVSKLISALALVVLGVAGWLLQWQTEKSRVRAGDFESQERKYLPTLRSLSDLELKLGDYVKELRQNRASSKQYEIGTELRFVASSVYEPDEDPPALLRGPATLMKKQFDLQSQMPLKATALMYGEMLRMRSFYEDLGEETHVQLDSDKCVLIVGDNRRDYIAPDSCPAFKTWMVGQPPVPLRFFREAPTSALLQDLRFAVTQEISKVLKAHPDLGDRYVQIRDQLETNRLSTINRN